MSWVIVAVIGGSALTAGAGYLGSKKQAEGAERSAGLNMDMFRVLNQQQSPFIQGGYGAMGKLNTLLGLNPNPRAATTPAQPPAFRPTPGGGVEPIMQVGAPTVQIPERSGNMRLNRLLAMRAANGDRQAQAMLRGGV